MPGLNQKLVSWQVAPAEYELSNYDAPKILYRSYVDNFLNSIPVKSLRKKIFYTISTNVLCADIFTSKRTRDGGDQEPIERDLYLPLEIALTKWSIMGQKNKNVMAAHASHQSVDPKEVEFDSKVWMINPGPPVRNCINIAKEHAKKHKITFDYDDLDGQNTYVTPYSDAIKEINKFLGPDRTVFSKELKYVRQDLGCLKWLNSKTGFKTNPISVYSLEDLYVLLMRKVSATPNAASQIGQGIARFKLDSNSEDHYSSKLQCLYHSKKTQGEGQAAETSYCALALSRCYSNIIANDLYNSLNVV